MVYHYDYQLVTTKIKNQKRALVNVKTGFLGNHYDSIFPRSGKEIPFFLRE